MRYLLLSFCVPLMAQTPDFGRTAQAGAQYDFTAAARTMPIKAGLSSATPSTCTASKELYIKTDAPPGQQLYLCSATGNGFVLVGDGAGSYTLPTATGSVLGGIKIGSGLSIDGGGVVTAAGGGNGYTLQLQGTYGTGICGNNLWFGIHPQSGVGMGSSEVDGWKLMIPKTGAIKAAAFTMHIVAAVTGDNATGAVALVTGTAAGTITNLEGSIDFPATNGRKQTLYSGLNIAVTAGDLVGGRITWPTCTSGSWSVVSQIVLYIE